MSDKCQHCTEVQVRLDMSMEIARLEAELAALKAEHQWHPASVRPDHNRQIIIATAGGHILHGNRFNLMPGDRWCEFPKPPKEEVWRTKK